MIPWSFSRLTDFETCPYRFQLKYIEKLPEAPNPAAERGTEIHKQYENFVLGKEPCPSPHFETQLQHLLRIYPHHSTETAWAFDKNWLPCGWFEDQAWVRIKPDLVVYTWSDTIIIDYKTGKENLFKHTAQGQLYAVGSYAIQPADKISVKFWYHDLNTEKTNIYNESQILKLKAQWTQRAQKIETDHFPPKPTKNNCKYCGMAPHCGYRIE